MSFGAKNQLTDKMNDQDRQSIETLAHKKQPDLTPLELLA